MVRTVAVLMGFAFLAGCANTQEVDAWRSEAQRTTPVCTSENQCQVMWSAARSWVLSHAGTKIQNYGTDYFDTYNPIPNSPSLAAQVSKDALGSGKHKISAKLWCDNMFGCQPNAWQALLDFNRTVNQAGSGQ
ncbi:hypothetical protein [Pseudomonas fontis]|uniref:Lipoprotein n=1 Tax=Pseudomonas fontis TaxID=2942633 RepID=A0ABT5NSF3_9PSED|nr:hypothetical protein [Pseudomonas fontis]MDD0974836.1 hypothetical protein [Pseudomonas fontis]MDD0991101.1 hypothetical protein [Pseudomonas fontis]